MAWGFVSHLKKYLVEMKYPKYLGDVQLELLPTPVKDEDLWEYLRS